MWLYGWDRYSCVSRSCYLSFQRQYCFTDSSFIFPSEGRSGQSWGGGVGRDTIQHFGKLRLESNPAFLFPGHHEQLVYVPALPSGRLRPTPDQLENTYVNGVALGLNLAYCESVPRGMALWSLLIHPAGTTEAFTRAAADAWMPDVVQAIDEHRRGNPGAFLCLTHLHLSIEVSDVSPDLYF